ncbi:MAG: gamma-glutamyltransferase family protein [Rhizobiales bacterium]|nr:gamma-glutamyltransferase family protein [Hyphomicrobiales bacterium]
MMTVSASRYPMARIPVLASNVVAASQPLAAQAGLRMLLAGGSAVDAALAAAATLTVVEPIMNGIGGDLYAAVWDGERLHALNSTGASPAAWHRSRFDKYDQMPMKGWDTVTVPGQVAGWRALSKRFGKLPFQQLFGPAVDYAERGFPVSPFVASVWSELAALVSDQPGFAKTFLIDGRPPVAGEVWRAPGHARALQAIAETEGESFYRGALAEAIVSFSERTGGCLSLDDFAAHEPIWCEPLSLQYRDYTLHELPPNGFGIAALMALGILEHFDVRAMGQDSADAYHVQIEAMRLAFADLYKHVSDPRSMRVPVTSLLDRDYLAQRARLIDLRRAGAPAPGKPRLGGTVYLTTADASGMMVSLIQSNYWAFGSGLVVPDLGIALHNRGSNFTLERGHPNEVGPRKVPLHTIIPGFVTRHGAPVMSFGVMGGAMQTQGHLQFLSRLGDFDQEPQSICDAPRFMLSPTDGVVNVEAHMPRDVANLLAARGHRMQTFPTGHLTFGSAQLISRVGNNYCAVSDPRRDGIAAGF